FLGFIAAPADGDRRRLGNTLLAVLVADTDEDVAPDGDLAVSEFSLRPVANGDRNRLYRFDRHRVCPAVTSSGARRSRSAPSPSFRTPRHPGIRTGNRSS